MVLRKVVQFDSFACSCIMFSTPFMEQAVFYPLACLLSHKSTTNMWLFFCAFYSVPLSCVFVLVPIPYCFDYCRSIIQFEIREHDTSSFVLSQDCFGYLGSFVSPYRFWDYLFQFCEKCHWYFDRDCTESVDCLKQYSHFNM